MQAGLERKIIRRVLGTLLLTGVLLVGGASGAAADGSDGCSDGYGHCGPTPTTTPRPTPPPTPHDPPSTHYGPTYPVPSVPPQAPPGTPRDNPSPPVLARTGSDSGTLVGIGAGALVVGGGLVVLARKRRLATVTT